ncbi:response regulator transcription factor [Salipaludibacillus daqingensis]|uniref:response regulator transcription factor n=1 Tax=Salipaludibacillus daqingensis TaxID=3041001 RepID=UPI00247632DE|nr:response regulator transcription factor [Salipaludibacillus daqingensis]
MRPKILLADDHRVLLSGIKLLLMQEDVDIVGEVSTAEDVIQEARKWKPDLILMDISMPVMGGIEATKLIKKEFPLTKVLILTMYSDEQYLKRALQAGANGYVIKKAVDSELVSAVHSVLDGDTYIYPTLTSKLLKNYMELPKKNNYNKTSELSPRELEVLKLIALGLTYQEIADQLFVSIKTIETHKRRLSEKLSLKKRSELVRYAVDNNLITM